MYFLPHNERIDIRVYDLEVPKCFNVTYSYTDVILIIALWPSYKTDCKLKISSCRFSLDRITTVSSGSPVHLNNRDKDPYRIKF